MRLLLAPLVVVFLNIPASVPARTFYGFDDIDDGGGTMVTPHDYSQFHVDRQWHTQVDDV